MPLFDEDEEAGLEDELQDETVDETADEEVPYGPLDSLVSIAELRKQLSSASSEAEKNRKVLEQIQAARLKLLEAPSRKEALMGLAQKLAAPRTQNDPRFYERQNLYTFLRDVGEYGQERKQAEKERQVKIAALEEMGAKYGLTEAQKTQAAAMRGLTSLAQRQMMIGARTQDAKNAADMGMTLKQYLEFKASLTKKPGDEGPGGEAAQFIWARRTLADPKASESDKEAANDLLQKKTPRDVRLSAISQDQNSKNYLQRIKEQTEFTIPIINEAIEKARAGGALATGNLSKWLEGKPWIGQAATDLERTLDSVRSNVGFEKLRELKEMSPSGASGLGAVSNAEQLLLQSVRGSISRDQSEDNLVRNLERIKNFYEKEIFDILERETGIRGITDINDALDAFRGQAQSGKSSSSAPSSGGGKSPAEMAADELRRRRAGKGD
jgi:hypothetical protein